MKRHDISDTLKSTSEQLYLISSYSSPLKLVFSKRGTMFITVVGGEKSERKKAKIRTAEHFLFGRNVVILKLTIILNY